MREGRGKRRRTACQASTHRAPSGSRGDAPPRPKGNAPPVGAIWPAASRRTLPLRSPTVRPTHDHRVADQRTGLVSSAAPAGAEGTYPRRIQRDRVEEENPRGGWLL